MLIVCFYMLTCSYSVISFYVFLLSLVRLVCVYYVSITLSDSGRIHYFCSSLKLEEFVGRVQVCMKYIYIATYM